MDTRIIRTQQRLLFFLLLTQCALAQQDYKAYLKFSHAEIDSLAYVEYRNGAYGKAILLAQAGREKVKVEFGEQDSLFAEYTYNLGFFYQRMGQYEKALPLLIQAKNIYEKVLGVAHPDFNSLALLYQRMGNYEKALSLHIQSKSIYEKVLGKEHPDFAVSLNNLATLHKKMGNYEKALPLFIQAKNIYERVLGAAHPTFAGALNNLATLHIEMRDYEKTWKSLLESMEVSSHLTLSRNISETWVDSLLQVPYASNFHLEQMLISLKITYDLLEKESVNTSKVKQSSISTLALELLDKLLQQTSLEKDKLRILQLSSGWIDKSLRVLDAEEQTSKAFNLADQNKSVLLF